jgi:Ca2+-binding EF-hand superfamily protein
MNRMLIIFAVGLAALAVCAPAQDAGRGVPPRGGPGGDNQGRGPRDDHQRPPPPPLIAALDVNRDGMLDEQEIAGASAALLKLDQNGDGKLTLDELRPPPPDGKDGPEGRGPEQGRPGRGPRPGGGDQQGAGGGGDQGRRGDRQGPPVGEAGLRRNRGEDGPPPLHPPPLIAALDANRDGVIDEEEIAGASAALKKLDKNGDGKLTLDELRPPPPDGRDGPEGRGPEQGRPGRGPRPGGGDQQGAGGGDQGRAGDRQGPPVGEGGPRRNRGEDGPPPLRPPPIVAALDVNADGVLDEQEIGNAPAALKKLDKNGDGQLTPDELHPPRPDGMGGPEGRGRGARQEPEKATGNF